MKVYKVIGPCAVADVQPGGTVTEVQLEEARAVVEPLLGIHLEEVTKPEPSKVVKVDTQ